jgi:hypothetical protein
LPDNWLITVCECGSVVNLNKKYNPFSLVGEIVDAINSVSTVKSIDKYGLKK